MATRHKLSEMTEELGAADRREAFGRKHLIDQLVEVRKYGSEQDFEMSHILWLVVEAAFGYTIWI